MKRLICPALTALLLLAACGTSSNSTYFGPSDQTMTSIAALPGTYVYIGLADLPSSSDDVGLHAMSISGLDSAVNVTGFVLERSATNGGGIGAMRDSDVRDAQTQALLDALMPLAGYTRAASGSDAQVVARFYSTTPVDVEFSSWTLSFTVAGQAQTEEFEHGAHLCFTPTYGPGVTCSDATASPIS
jgi:hypothetical protein